jgi:hypothetical protein
MKMSTPPMDSGVLRLLLGRATGDSAFLERFLSDPAAAAAELHITLTQEFIDFILSLNGELRSDILASSQQVMAAAGPSPNWSVT